MAQSAVTVTPPSPTPPTNFGSTGATAPNPPNYTKNTQRIGPDGTILHVNDNWGSGTPTYPPPFYDDGTAGAATTFHANVAALASGSGATAGGTGMPTAVTGGSYPWPLYGTGTLGDTPASSSVAHEGAGSESVVTQTYAAGICVAGSAATYIPTGQTPTWSAGDPGGPLKMFSDLGNYTTTPNGDHASSLSPTTNPALTSITPNSSASGVGTVSMTATGTNFTPQSVIYVNGVAQTTVFVSKTSLTATVTKKTSAGTWPVTVITGSVVTTAAQTWTFT